MIHAMNTKLFRKLFSAEVAGTVLGFVRGSYALRHDDAKRVCRRNGFPYEHGRPQTENE